MRRCPHCGKRIIVTVSVDVRPPAVSVRKTPEERAAADRAADRITADIAAMNRQREAFNESWRVKNAERERTYADRKNDV